MKLVSKSDLGLVLLDDTVPFDQLKDLVLVEFNLDVPEDVDTKEKLLDFTYDHYLKIVEKYKINQEAIYRKETKKHHRSGTAKEFIINTIQEKKTLTIKELHEIVDEEYGYSKVGKSPRTRCRKVLDQLKVENKVDVSPERVITWKV